MIGSKSFALLVSGLFLLINLTTISQYGASYDEEAGMIRGKTVVDYLKLVSDTGTITKINVEKVHFHPTFYACINYASSLFWSSHFGLGRIAAAHLLNVLIFSAGLIVLFFFTRQMFDDRIALFSVLLLACYPRLIAHSHYNSKDVPLMVFALASIALAYRALWTARASGAFVAGVVFGASVATKLDGLFVLAIFAAICIGMLASGRKVGAMNGKQALSFFAIFLISGCFYVYFLWPVLWGDPLFLFRSVHRFSQKFEDFRVAYLGKWYANDQVPWHYTLVHLAAVTPCLTLASFIVGLGVSAKLVARRGKVLECGLLWAWITFPILARIRSGTPQYDGIRHVFIILPAIAIIGALGMARAMDFISAFGRSGFYIKASAVIVALIVAAEIYMVHPYEGSYVNEIVQLSVRRGLGDYFDFYSWGTAMQDGIRWLNHNAPENAKVAALGDGQMLSYYEIRPDISITNQSRADFLIVPGWKRDLEFSKPPCFVVSRYNTPLLLIYAEEARPQN